MAFPIWQPSGGLSRRPDPMQDIFSGIMSGLEIFSKYQQIKANNEKLKMDKDTHEVNMALAKQEQYMNELKIQTLETQSSNLAMETWMAQKQAEYYEALDKKNAYEMKPIYLEQKEQLRNQILEASTADEPLEKWGKLNELSNSEEYKKYKKLYDKIAKYTDEKIDEISTLLLERKNITIPITVKEISKETSETEAGSQTAAQLLAGDVGKKTGEKEREKTKIVNIPIEDVINGAMTGQDDYAKGLNEYLKALPKEKREKVKEMLEKRFDKDVLLEKLPILKTSNKEANEEERASTDFEQDFANKYLFEGEQLSPEEWRSILKKIKQERGLSLFELQQMGIVKKKL